MKLIDKSALVAEIESLLDKGKYHEEYDCAYRDGNNGALYALKGKLDTLEVKEVHKEPVSEKKCIFTKDNYTDEERKVLCDGCEEECEYNKEEPVSEGLEQAAHQRYEANDTFMDGFKKGAKWQKENLWKPADGNDLPVIDREVIALLDNGKVVFAHRPPEYWDGKNIITGEVTRNYPKTYDKGGWNIPNIKYWLDVRLPKEIEL